MLGTVFGFDAYVCNTDGCPDYYRVLSAPYQCSAELLTQQLLRKVTELKRQEDEAIEALRQHFDEKAPWLAPVEQWATPKSAKLAAILIEAHTVLADRSERAMLYNHGGHSALLFMRKVCRRSQGFLFSAFAGFFTFKHAVTVAGIFRCVFFVLAIVFLVLASRSLEMADPVPDTAGRLDAIPKFQTERPPSWAAVFVPVYLWMILQLLAALWSMARAARLMTWADFCYFFRKRLNGLRACLPLTYFALMVGVQRRLDGRRDAPWLTDGLAPFWVLLVQTIIIEAVHVMDTFMMPLTIPREAAQERLQTELFGYVHQSLQQDRETFYWAEIPHTVGNIGHILTHLADVAAGIACPCALAILLLSRDVSAPMAAAPWHRYAVPLYVRIGTWALAALTNGALEVIAAEQRRVTLRNFTERCTSTGVWGWAGSPPRSRRHRSGHDGRTQPYDAQSVVVSTAGTSTAAGTASSGKSARSAAGTISSSSSWTARAKAGPTQGTRTDNRDAARGGVTMASLLDFYRSVWGALLTVLLQVGVVTGLLCTAVYVGVQKLSGNVAITYPMAAAPLFALLALGLLCAVAGVIGSLTIHRYVPSGATTTPFDDEEERIATKIMNASPPPALHRRPQRLTMAPAPQQAHHRSDGAAPPPSFLSSANPTPVASNLSFSGGVPPLPASPASPLATLSPRLMVTRARALSQSMAGGSHSRPRSHDPAPLDPDLVELDLAMSLRRRQEAGLDRSKSTAITGRSCELSASMPTSSTSSMDPGHPNQRFVFSSNP